MEGVTELLPSSMTKKATQLIVLSSATTSKFTIVATNFLTSASNVIQQLSASTTSAAQTLNPKDTINGTILYDAASKIAYKSWEQQHFYLRMDNNDNDAKDGNSMVTIGSSSISISISISTSTSTIIIITAYTFEECKGDNEKITETIKLYNHKI